MLELHLRSIENSFRKPESKNNQISCSETWLFF